MNDLIFDYDIDYGFISQRHKSPLSIADRAKFNIINSSLEIPLTDTTKFFLTNPDIACRMLEAKVITPSSIPFALRRSNKEIAKVLVSIWQKRAGIPDKYFDDIDFILDCAAKQGPDDEYYIRQNMSTRLKEIVGSQPIIPTLRAHDLSFKLNLSLVKASNANQQRPPKV